MLKEEEEEEEASHGCGYKRVRFKVICATLWFGPELRGIMGDLWRTERSGERAKHESAPPFSNNSFISRMRSRRERNVRGYSRVPSKRVAMVSRKVFCGAMSPRMTGMRERVEPRLSRLSEPWPSPAVATKPGRNLDVAPGAPPSPWRRAPRRDTRDSTAARREEEEEEGCGGEGRWSPPPPM